MLFVRRAKVAGTKVVQDTRVVNLEDPRLNRLFNFQRKGGTVTPLRGRYLLVPQQRGGRKPTARTLRKRPGKDFIAKDTVFRKVGKRTTRTLGYLETSVLLKKRYYPERAIPAIERRMGALLRRALLLERQRLDRRTR